MEDVTVLLARATAWVESHDLNPRGAGHSDRASRDLHVWNHARDVEWKNIRVGVFLLTGHNSKQRRGKNSPSTLRLVKVKPNHAL
jgi:hypothetical protein